MTLFETLAYDEYDCPFDSIDEVARFILNLENCAPMYNALRSLIRRHALTYPNPPWSGNAIGIIRNLPQARNLYGEGFPLIARRTAIAVLDRAVALMRCAS